MERMLKRFLCIAVLFSSAIVSAATNTVTPYYSIRSQGFDAARELVGWGNDFHIKLFDAGEAYYGSLSVTPEYTRSFRDERIANCLFGDDLVNCDCPTLKIQGSSVTDRDSKAWLADYFGLPTDFSSEFTFKPRVSNFIIDFNLFVGLDNWWQGLYFRAHTPFVHTRWELNVSETVSAEGTTAHSAGYFNESTIARSSLLTNATEFFTGNKAPNLGDTVSFQKLNCSKWAGCNETLTENKLAEVSAALGWNFFLEDDYHLGAEIRFAGPTGTRPDACHLFEAIVGNGHHWALGGGVSGHIMLWRSEDENSHLGFYVDANIEHLFKTRQRRAFDLKAAKGNSRYMLAAKMQSTNVVNLLAATAADGDPTGGGTAPSAQFDNVFAPVANLTCCNVDVSSSVQGDVVAMFNYTNGGFGWDLGYNFWARACEKIKLDCDCPCPLQDQKNTWVLKGDAHVYGFGASDATVVAQQNQPIALSSSNSQATVRSGTNKVSTIAANEQDRNSQIDNATLAILANGANDRIMNATGISAATVADQQRTSGTPVFLGIDDVDLDGAKTKGLSHKIFTHLQYTWKDRDGWIPYVGVGAKVEFASGNSCDSDCDTSCDTSSCSTKSCESSCSACHKCSLSEWGVWVKGGISFN